MKEGDVVGPPEVDFDSDNVPDPTSVTYIDYDNPFELVKDASGAPHINQISKFAWVGCGADIYVLECMGKGYVRIEPDIDDSGDECPRMIFMRLTDALPIVGERYFTAHYTAAAEGWEMTSKTRKSRFNRPRKILTASALDEAVRGCDTYVLKKVAFGGLALGFVICHDKFVLLTEYHYHSLLRSARWRKSPASDSQKAIITKRTEGRSAGNGFGVTFDVSTLTKGQAANIITRLKHGAQVG